ncbi:MAG: IS30 family transposase [Tetragenococcus koreensis]|nr:IS30 family transposase [Tetragenococcus koreensis]
MPDTNSSTKTTKTYKHLNKTERKDIERWLKEGKNQSEIARLLDRDRSTVSREIKRGTTIQIKETNGYQQEVKEYYADTGQAVYDKNRKKSQSKGLESFSQKFWADLEEANKERLFSGKKREYNIKTFISVYQRENPSEKIPTYKTIYNYIHRGNFFINPIDLPVMVRLKPRRNKGSKPKGTNKKILGRSISERPETVLNRESIGHWEADLVEGKKGKDEPVVLTLVDRLSRFAISRKLTNAKSDTIQKALLNITKENPEAFDSITFDNGSEFSQAASLENEPALDLKVYFCHAYSAWERGTNENFNKLLRDFLPKGKSMHSFTDKEVIKAAESINRRVREVNDYQSANEVYRKMKK